MRKTGRIDRLAMTALASTSLARRAKANRPPAQGIPTVTRWERWTKRTIPVRSGFRLGNRARRPLCPRTCVTARHQKIRCPNMPYNLERTRAITRNQTRRNMTSLISRHLVNHPRTPRGKSRDQEDDHQRRLVLRNRSESPTRQNPPGSTLRRRDGLDLVRKPHRSNPSPTKTQPNRKASAQSHRSVPRSSDGSLQNPRRMGPTRRPINPSQYLSWTPSLNSRVRLARQRNPPVLKAKALAWQVARLTPSRIAMIKAYLRKSCERRLMAKNGSWPRTSLSRSWRVLE